MWGGDGLPDLRGSTHRLRPLKGFDPVSQGLAGLAYTVIACSIIREQTRPNGSAYVQAKVHEYLSLPMRTASVV